MNIETPSKAFVHPLAEVGQAAIGEGSRIWQFCVVLDGAIIGRDCNICSHCLVEAGSSIGHRVTVKSGVQVWKGVHLEDDVFVGPNVTFTNDKHPRSGNRHFECRETYVRSGASIGGGAVILPGIEIGAGATVGAGSVVTRDVAPGTTVIGNPARPLNTKNRRSGD